MERNLRSIHEGIIGWSCEAHSNKDFGHRLFFGLGAVCAGPGDPIYEPKWLEARKEEEIYHRKLTEFFEMYPEYAGRAQEVTKILDKFY